MSGAQNPSGLNTLDYRVIGTMPEKYHHKLQAKPKKITHLQIRKLMS